MRIYAYMGLDRHICIYAYMRIDTPAIGHMAPLPYGPLRWGHSALAFVQGETGTVDSVNRSTRTPEGSTMALQATGLPTVTARWRGQAFGAPEGVCRAIAGDLPGLGHPGIHRAAYTDGTWAYKVPISWAGNRPNEDEYDAMTTLRRHHPPCPATALVSPICLWTYLGIVVAVMRVYPHHPSTASDAARRAFDDAVRYHHGCLHSPLLTDLHDGNIRADRNHRLHIIDLGFGVGG